MPARRAVRQIVGHRYQSQVFWRRFRWITLALVVLAVAAVPGYPAAKRLRARSLANRAEQELAGRHPEDASRPLKVALDLAPKDPVVLRTAARYSARFHLPSSLNYWDMVVHTSEATDADRKECVDEALRYRRFDLAEEQLRLLDRTRPNDREVAHQKIRLLLDRYDPAAAMRVARQLVDREPEEPHAQFVLGDILRQFGSKTERRAGRRFLWGVAVGKSEWRDDAIDALLPDRELTRGENELLLKALQERQPLTARSRVQIAELRTRLEPDAGSRIAAELLPAASENSTVTDRQMLASWLSRHGFHEQVLDCLPLNSSATNALLAGLRLSSMAALDRWAEIEHLVTGTGPRIENSIAALFRGEIAAQRGLRDQAQVHFRDALGACTNRADVLFFIARRADRVGFTSLGVEGLLRLMRLPQFTVPAAREVLALVEPHDDLPAAKRAVEGLAAFLPGDPAVATELAYYQLILGDNVRLVQDRLTQLRTAHPNQPDIRQTLAFALLRSQRPAEALALMETEGWDWKQAAPRWQAVYAAILGETKQRSAAREVATRIDHRRLKTQERELIRPWL